MVLAEDNRDTDTSFPAGPTFSVGPGAAEASRTDHRPSSESLGGGKGLVFLSTGVENEAVRQARGLVGGWEGPEGGLLREVLVPVTTPAEGHPLHLCCLVARGPTCESTISTQPSAPGFSDAHVPGASLL